MGLISVTVVGTIVVRVVGMSVVAMTAIVVGTGVSMVSTTTYDPPVELPGIVVGTGIGAGVAEKTDADTIFEPVMRG